MVNAIRPFPYHGNLSEQKWLCFGTQKNSIKEANACNNGECNMVIEQK